MRGQPGVTAQRPLPVPPGDRCHSRESTSAATAASGHQASATASSTLPTYSLALNISAGSPSG